MKILCIVDVSDSMMFPRKNGESRLKIASNFAAILKEKGATIYVSSGSNAQQVAQTEKVPDNISVNELYEYFAGARIQMMGGGMFVDKAIRFITHYEPKPDYLYILTDEVVIPTECFSKSKTVVVNCGDENVDLPLW